MEPLNDLSDEDEYPTESEGLSQNELKAAGLDGVIDDFERIGKEVFSDGIWTCNGGAVFLKYLCDRAGLSAELCVGLYYWDEENLEELQQNLGRGEDDNFLDEHHHWVVVHGTALPVGGVIIDPNAECRHEVRVQVAAKTGRYRADDAEGQWSGIYSYTTPAEVAEWDQDVARAIELAAA
jgi:hypothetical protein